MTDNLNKASYETRVRFAPSPTGYLHIGGARTAIFNWLYARHTKGKFILRIEDTDKERSKKEYLDEILDSLSWMGMNWDELYYQSERFDIYREYAEKLLKARKAYTAENGAIIFKVEAGKIKINDLIRGEIEFDAETIKDQVLIKEDKTPTYNFACVVDDALMHISHVLRGDDHISNTPKQAVLYEALGFKMPKFAHLPLILGEGGGRLSKRTGATAISEWRKAGYLAGALRNYLLLLGWSLGNNQELINMDEAIKKFEIKDVNKTAAVFDVDKLTWLNAQHIKKCAPEEFLDLSLPFLTDAGFIKADNFDRKYALAAVTLFQTRISTLADFADFADFAFSENFKLTDEAREKFLQNDLTREFNLLLERFEGIGEFNHANIEEKFRQLVKELGIKAGDLVHPVRIALSGKTVGPGLFETIALLGKDKTKERLTMAEKLWKAAPKLKCLILWIALGAIGVVFSGCGTFRGMQEDYHTMQNWDKKFQDNWW